MRLILLLTAALLACGGDDDGGGADAAESGRACTTGLAADDPTSLASPALECPTGLCLHVEGALPDLCTADCDEPADCLGATGAACEGEYLCVAPIALGPFACRTVCVCDSAVPEGGFPVDC